MVFLDEGLLEEEIIKAAAGEYWNVASGAKDDVVLSGEIAIKEDGFKNRRLKREAMQVRLRSRSAKDTRRPRPGRNNHCNRMRNMGE